jgi:hypothetical protein
VSWFVRAEPGVWARSDAAYHWLAGTSRLKNGSQWWQPGIVRSIPCHVVETQMPFDAGHSSGQADPRAGIHQG